MPEPLTLIALALTAAGTAKASMDAKADARALQSRQRRLFEEQDNYSKKTQSELLANLKHFSADQHQQYKNEAGEDALKTIQRVANASKSTRKGSPNLGTAGKVSSASSKKAEEVRMKNQRENAIRNQALANFLGISGGAVKEGREVSNLQQALNQLRTDAKGQRVVDQARIAHSPKKNPMVANLLKAAGMVAGFASAAGSAGASAGSSSAAISKADAARTFADGATNSGNWLGQTGGSAMQGFAPGASTVNAASSSAPQMFNYGSGFSNSLGLGASPQFGARWLQSAPQFDKLGNFIPR